MRRSVGIPLSLLFVLGLLVPVWANQEMHPGGRVFFPLWDVSTPSRLTFIILTREAMNDGQAILPTFVSTTGGVSKNWRVVGTGNCIPQGRDGSSSNVNRTDLGGTGNDPVFVDDVHLTYYGRSCARATEIVHMSCADIDLFLLASSDNQDGLRPRRGFAAVANEKRGALEAHLITNNADDSRERKWENSLMGLAIISELAEGWAAAYHGASAQAAPCLTCAIIDDGSPVGYENYPMEVYIPFGFADDMTAPAGKLRNILSLWAPGLLPGGNLNGTFITVDWKWWDGRERHRFGSIPDVHSIIRPLGGDPIAGLDAPIDSSGFRLSNFVCGQASPSQAENDGFPRNGSPADNCAPGAPGYSVGSPDTADPSDNFENLPDINSLGHSMQASIPIGWWRFQLRRDNLPPTADPDTDHSGRGLVGVLLSPSGGTTPFFAVGDSWRLWHKEPCGIAQSAETRGPLHTDPIFKNDADFGELVSLFNTEREPQEICRPIPLL